MKCAEADAFIHAYVDGELAGMDREAYEQHLVDCDGCSHACRLQARFKAAVRGHLPPHPVPESLRQRIHVSLVGAPSIQRRRVWHTYPRLVPAAAAAVMLVGVLGVARTGRPNVVLEQALNTYHSALPMDVLGPSCTSIADWFRGRVNFAVPQQRKLGPCQGGRIVNVQDRFGAYIQYQVANGHRVDMMVLNGDDELLAGARRRVVNGRDLYFGVPRGASTAAYRDRDGLIYIVTSDIDEDALTNLVEAALFTH